MTYVSVLNNKQYRKSSSHIRLRVQNALSQIESSTGFSRWPTSSLKCVQTLNLAKRVQAGKGFRIKYETYSDNSLPQAGMAKRFCGYVEYWYITANVPWREYIILANYARPVMLRQRDHRCLWNSRFG